MKSLSKFLREQAVEITIFFKKEMKLVTKEQQESRQNAKNCYVCKEKFKNKSGKDKKYRKFIEHCHYKGEYRGAAHSICNLKYSVPKKNSYSFS